MYKSYVCLASYPGHPPLSMRLHVCHGLVPLNRRLSIVLREIVALADTQDFRDSGTLSIAMTPDNNYVHKKKITDSGCNSTQTVIRN